jgi:hypothetical protein
VLSETQFRTLKHARIFVQWLKPIHALEAWQVSGKPARPDAQHEVCIAFYHIKRILTPFDRDVKEL